MIWTGKQLQEALKVEVNHDLQAGIIQFNSKDITKDDLFIAIAGKTDGHNYVKDAIIRGASCVIVEKPIDGISPEQTIIVTNTKLALDQLASYKRANSKARFIAVTGSVGKTSAKEALKIMFEAYGKTFASRGNFNNELGVAINLASMPCDVEYAIFELGMNHAGEIRELVKIVKPDIAMITSISAAHLEFFSSIEDIVDAKCEIFENMNVDGAAVINRDSVYYDQMNRNVQHNNISNIYTFGVLESAKVQLIDYKVELNKTRVQYSINNTKIVIDMPYILPVHQAENFAGCFAVLSSLGLNMTKAAEAVKGFELDDGRGKIIRVRKSDKKFQIICDYYNSNPASLKASLNFFRLIEHPNKVVIIGDMKELGDSSANLHAELVPYIIGSGATKIILVGVQVKFINDLLPKKMYIKQFDNVDVLMPELESILEDGEFVLIKGSRSINLQKILEYFDKD